MDFSTHILQWYHKGHRNLPWRATKETYKVWLSEIILQQTRVEQGITYYENFTFTFPTIKDLALADEEQVLKIWQGLGYYSRARNLHATAKHIHFNLNGEFPSEYKEIIKLKGIGPYTAAAISSICYNEKKAAVDGNVYRVLSRVFDISTAINSTQGIKQFQKLADSLICESNPGDYNQGLMELGATICTPKKTNCELCPLNTLCLANNKKTIHLLPVKIKKTKIKERHLHYFCIEHDNQLLMNKRTGKDIWKNLYDFPMEERSSIAEELPIENYKKINEIIGNNSFSINNLKEYKHILSHQILNIKIYYLTAKGKLNPNNYIAVNLEETFKLPVPKPIEKFISSTFKK